MCCYKKPSKVHVDETQEYINKNSGPEFMIEVRYAQLSQTMFICLMYSGGMPILYICAFFFIFLTYWIDKLLFLRFYRIPPKYDSSIAKILMRKINVAIIVHTCFSIWTYGNVNYLYSSESNKILISLNDSKSYADEIKRRIKEDYNIILFVFLLVFIGFIIFYYFILEILILIFKSDNGNSYDENSESETLDLGLGKKIY